MMKQIGILSLAAVSIQAATRDLIELARQKPGSPQFRQALTATLGEEHLKAGTAAVSLGADALFALEAVGKPALYIDDAPAAAMKQIHGTNLWFAAPTLETGRSHSFHYMLGGKRFGGKTDVPAFGPDSYAKPGVPQGKLSEKIRFTSRIYDGMTSDYWVYVPEQYDPKTPAALMVWQDGHFYNVRDSDTNRTLDTIDNLTYQKKIPVMIQVFTSPGDVTMPPDSPTYAYVKKFAESTGRPLKDSLRSTEYDTVSDRYARFLRDELLAEVQSKYNIRKDAYSRAITGLSSGGICALNVAWWQPDQFSRVLSWIGSYGSIQWQPGVLSRAAKFIPSRFVKRRSGTFASGCRMERWMSRALTEAGPYRIFNWRTP